MGSSAVQMSIESLYGLPTVANKCEEQEERGFDHNTNCDFNGGFTMVWGRISSDARTKLVILVNRLTATRYIEEFLQEHVLVNSGYIGPDLFLQTDDR